MVEKLIAIGVSLGGFDALPTLLGGLARDLAAACVIVQHRPPDDDSILDRMLGQLSGRTVREPDHHEAIVAGSIYLAPANYHLLVDTGHFALSTEGRVLFARPSIDVFFASASECYEERVIAVCMTGSSRDGAIGAQAVYRRGGTVLVHDPKTAHSPVAPRAALETVPKALVLRLDELAPKLNELCGTTTGKGTRPSGAQ